MDLIRKYTLTFAALILWVLSAIIFNGSGLLIGLAIGTFLFEQGIAPGLAEQILKLTRLDKSSES